MFSWNIYHRNSRTIPDIGCHLAKLRSSSHSNPDFVSSDPLVPIYHPEVSFLKSIEGFPDRSQLVSCGLYDGQRRREWVFSWFSHFVQFTNSYLIMYSVCAKVA